MNKKTINNPVKKKLLNGEIALGMSIRISKSPDVVRLAKTSGHDFIFIDTQHSIFNLESIANLAHTALSCGIAPMVRVKGINDIDVALLLDNGVTGIVFPDIRTREDALRAVEICRFAPLGKRSVTGGYSQFNFERLTTAESMDRLENDTLVVCMIEDSIGLENIEAICNISGIDVIHFGAHDFAASIGKPGQLQDLEVLEAQAKVIKTARKNNKFVGCAGGRDIGKQVNMLKSGVQLITTNSDFGFLLNSAEGWVKDIKSQLNDCQ